MSVVSGPRAFGRFCVFFRGVFIFTIMSATLAQAQAIGAANPSTPAPNSTTTAPPAVSSEYLLGTGDTLRITVFGEDNLGGQFTVAGNGRLSFPLIGDVEAAGKTVGAVQDEIANALRDGYIKDPKVSAEVLTFRPYFILGEVAHPGQYPYVDGITVMNAIATAGGFTYRASHGFVFIKRSTESSEHKVHLDSGLLLSPGDTVRVAERYF